MTMRVIGQSRFRYASQASFIGGFRFVILHKPEAETGMYIVTMALGSKPDCGRWKAEKGIAQRGELECNLT